MLFAVLGAAPAAFAASVAVDVGHYREKPGVISARGVTEFEYNLQLSREVAAALRHAGHKVILILGENRPFADEANGVHYFDNLAALKTASIPALLFEAGVIVNRDEELRMRDPVLRGKIAEGIAMAIGTCLG